MKYLTLSFLLLLSACKTTTGLAPDPKIPSLPESLSTKAESLPELTDPSFGDVLIDSSKTSMQYNDVAIRYNALIDLYICVQKSMNEKKDPKTCLK